MQRKLNEKKAPSVLLLHSSDDDDNDNTDDDTMDALNVPVWMGLLCGICHYFWSNSYDYLSSIFAVCVLEMHINH